MVGVLRVVVVRQAPTVAVQVRSLGWWIEAETEEDALFEVQCRYADALGILPEQIRIIAFRDCSHEGPLSVGRRR
jgi:hypothetical protein